jgi:hypothetical protein
VEILLANTYSCIAFGCSIELPVLRTVRLGEAQPVNWLIKRMMDWTFKPQFPVVRVDKKPDGFFEVELRVRVVTYQDHSSGMYIAQCIDVDYMASGDSEEDAEQRFVIGFNDTVDFYLEEHGSLDHFIRPPAACATADFYSAILSQPPKKKRKLDSTFSHGRMRGDLSFLEAIPA